MVCTLEFSPDGRLLASGGMAKQVRLYTLNSTLHGSSKLTQRGAATPPAPPVAVVRMPSKISSIAWSNVQPGVVAVGDYDGTLSQVHVGSGHLLGEVDAHGGRRIWSVAASRTQPALLGSCGDDGIARLWDARGLCEESVATELAPLGRAGGPLCSIDLGIAGRDQLVGLASANHCAYVYDLRAPSTPLAVLRHHSRAVSYVRFCGDGRLATASTDGSIASWDLAPLLGLEIVAPAATQQQQQLGDLDCVLPGSERCSASPGRRHSPPAHGLSRGNSSGGVSSSCSGGSSSTGVNNRQLRTMSARTPSRTFRGHVNDRHFVGLAARPEDGLLACGSETETGGVYVYQESWAQPLAVFEMSAGGGCGGGWPPPLPSHAPSQFVSAVAWHPAGEASLGAPPLLAAATSSGQVRLLALAEP